MSIAGRSGLTGLPGSSVNSSAGLGDESTRVVRGGVLTTVYCQEETLWLMQLFFFFFFILLSYNTT